MVAERIGLMATADGPVLVAGACSGEDLLQAELRIAAADGEVLWRISGRTPMPAEVTLSAPPQTMDVEVPFNDSFPASGKVNISYDSTEPISHGELDVWVSDLQAGRIVGPYGDYRDIESFVHDAALDPPCGIGGRLRNFLIIAIGCPVLAIGLLIIDLWLRHQGYSKPWKPPPESARIGDPVEA